MAKVKAFRCVRPNADVVSRVAALPYDVYDRKEAKKAVEGNPLSFLNIDRPETQFGDDFDMYSDEAYQKARDMLQAEIADGTFVKDETPAFYIYEQTVEAGALMKVMPGRSQTGIVACSSVDDYLNDVVRKHENTREEKEQDRIRHVDVCGAQTGPIFLTYRSDPDLKAVMAEAKKETPLYDFVSDDGIRHRIWKIGDPAKTARIAEDFGRIPVTYIADGHHRAASAVKVALKRRAEHPDYTGEEEFNWFLSVLFPDDELQILPYNRVVKDLKGLSCEDFLLEADACFALRDLGDEPAVPEYKAEIGLYMDHHWYRMEARDGVFQMDPVADLDVSILQDCLLGPVLGIEDPRTSDRISFIGGIRGTEELVRLVDSGAAAAAFAMYPTQMSELLAVADAGLLMPPKSTWFEPKLRSGIFIHLI